MYIRAEDIVAPLIECVWSTCEAASSILSIACTGMVGTSTILTLADQKFNVIFNRVSSRSLPHMRPILKMSITHCAVIPANGRLRQNSSKLVWAIWRDSVSKIHKICVSCTSTEIKTKLKMTKRWWEKNTSLNLQFSPSFPTHRLLHVSKTMLFPFYLDIFIHYLPCVITGFWFGSSNVLYFSCQSRCKAAAPAPCVTPCSPHDNGLNI